MSIYRKLWESHYGPIPKDDSGRSLEIHHIDGNHSNNSIENLKLVTIQEHYDIHFVQKDYGACYAIARRMRLSPKQLSKIAKELSRKQIINRTHHLLGPEHNRKRIEAGTHNFLDSNFQRKVANEKVKNGTHPFLGNAITKKQLLDGTHSSQKEHICPHCDKKGRGNTMFARHFDKCKYKKN
jgi:hypothetical protein